MAKKSKSPWSRVGRFVLRIVLPFAALLLALDVIAFRLRVGPVIDAVRALNKRLTNPAMMKLAGRRHWYAAAIRHKGRRSGKEYATPVMAEPIEDGFIVPLPYGIEVDWLKNVLAEGRATVEAKGAAYTVVEPEVIGAEKAFPLLPPRLRRTWRLFGIERFLKVKRLFESSL